MGIESSPFGKKLEVTSSPTNMMRALVAASMVALSPIADTGTARAEDRIPVYSEETLPQSFFSLEIIKDWSTFVNAPLSGDAPGYYFPGDASRLPHASIVLTGEKGKKGITIIPAPEHLVETKPGGAGRIYFRPRTWNQPGVPKDMDTKRGWSVVR